MEGNKSILNSRQQDIYHFIASFCRENGYPPTVREIGAAVGLKSTSNVHAHLKALIDKGFIQMDPLRQRSIRMVHADTHIPTRRVPVVGSVAAGSPILAFDDVEHFVPLPLSLLHGAQDSEVFLLAVEGESMIEAGIFDGDYILVHRGLRVENGDIGVVRVSAVYGEAATVKRIYRESGALRLQPENSAMEAISVPLDSVDIVGKVIGLFRQY